MIKWHVWGDFALTRPESIGAASAVAGEERSARETAERSGFDFERRIRNGFEPWAATYAAHDDDGQEFQFAACPVVRGWQKIADRP